MGIDEGDRGGGVWFSTMWKSNLLFNLSLIDFGLSWCLGSLPRNRTRINCASYQA